MAILSKNQLQKLVIISIIVLCIAVITSCSMLEEVQQSTHAISANRTTVESSTKAIAENKSIIQQSNDFITTNAAAVRLSSQAIAENQQAIASSNKIITENRNLIQKANLSIKANAETIALSTKAIQANIAAVAASSAMIRKNAEVVQESTEMLSRLKLNPAVIGLAALVLMLAMLVIPGLMIVFMWRIHRDIRLVLHKPASISTMNYGIADIGQPDGV